jgi:hypothetical protein
VKIASYTTEQRVFVVKVLCECNWITDSISVFMMLSKNWVVIMFWKFERTGSVLVKVKGFVGCKWTARTDETLNPVTYGGSSWKKSNKVSMSQQNHCSAAYRWHARWWIYLNRTRGALRDPCFWTLNCIMTQWMQTVNCQMLQKLYTVTNNKCPSKLMASSCCIIMAVLICHAELDKLWWEVLKHPAYGPVLPP